MTFELWELVSLSHMEPLQPFFLVSSKNSFEEIYQEFLETIKIRPCVILLRDSGDRKETA